MTHQIRCKCGWSSQVSDFYLGDRVTCPACNAKVEVSASTSIPYAYPPYSTWGKKPAPYIGVRHRRLKWRQRDDVHASPAFWLGVGAMFLTLSGCGILPGILLAMFAIRSGRQSFKFCREHRVARPVRAGLGTALGISAILISLLMTINMLASHLDRSAQCKGHSNVQYEVESRAEHDMPFGPEALDGRDLAVSPAPSPETVDDRVTECAEQE